MPKVTRVDIRHDGSGSLKLQKSSKSKPQAEEPVKKKKRKDSAAEVERDVPKTKTKKSAPKLGDRIPEVPKKKRKKGELPSSHEVVLIDNATDHAVAVLQEDGESVHKRQYATMLKLNKRIIKKLRDQMFKEGTNLNSRDIYALSTIMSQQREVIADIRAMTDQSGQIELIKTRILQPASVEMVGTIQAFYYQLRKLLSNTTKPDETTFALSQLDNFIRELAQATQNSMTSINTKIEDSLRKAV